MPDFKTPQFGVVDYNVIFYWEDVSGTVHTTRPRACEATDRGLRVECTMAIARGTEICVEIPRTASTMEGVVECCVAEGAMFRIDVQYMQNNENPTKKAEPDTDYYEILQLSPKADLDTIRRVYRIMAARFHPDNQESGNQERFLQLSEAFRVLSDPALRAKYDSVRGSRRPRPLPLFQAKAFVDEKEGESHRRLGVLCLLYAQRRRNLGHPTITLIELEEMMAIPREYLEFTLWYLKQKKYVEMDSGADYCLTAAGVDFVEEHSSAQDILVRMLASGESRTGGGLTSEQTAV